MNLTEEKENEMTTELATRNGAEVAAQHAATDDAVIDALIGSGDISKMSATERTDYYRGVCRSTGLNPLTQPFEYITLNGKMKLYPKKDATDQLRSINGVSIVKLERVRDGDSYEVTAYAEAKDGRRDSSLGAVFLKGLSGEAYSNALMKAETKAKRRVTLSICGLGWLDESEVDSIPGARIGENDDRQRNAPRPQIAAPEKPARSPQSGALFAKVSSYIRENLDGSQIADLKAQHGALAKLTDAQLEEVYMQVEKIVAAQNEANGEAVAETPQAEGDPFAPGAE
jgi:hypothetical protein